MLPRNVELQKELQQAKKEANNQENGNRSLDVKARDLNRRMHWVRMERESSQVALKARANSVSQQQFGNWLSANKNLVHSWKSKCVEEREGQLAQYTQNNQRLREIETQNSNDGLMQDYAYIKEQYNQVEYELD